MIQPATRKRDIPPEPVAVIGGAEHPVGRCLLERLVARGLRGVAIGADEECLMNIARAVGPMVDTLGLRPGRGALFTHLREAWGAMPVTVYVDLMALAETPEAQGSERIARAAALAAALGQGIRAGSARGVIAVPRIEGSDAAPRSFEGLVRQLDSDLRPGRMLGLSFPPHPDWTGAEIDSAADAILSLSENASRGLKGGVILSWNPQEAGALGQDRLTDEG
ncbi:hypothetical protein [Thetidibacter halocola]|uniref:Uncharacterized protein n=1 Tax=Thetidibacter halocola TaxID=2827239 RepID=A0A8J8B6M1_9RHOB|nr:hypothetical protein [Thetidibacter halocola]MBS0122794.1 hypothetical protein [Thetidibacter halocola]